MHGELCDMCFKNCLHPCDSDQQIGNRTSYQYLCIIMIMLAHKRSCVAMHEKEMEKAFAVKKLVLWKFTTI